MARGSVTGVDGDGFRGVQLIDQIGGKVIAQDQATSKVWSMPAAAIAMGYINWVLPLDRIGR